ncbi:MAG: 2-oxo acid dehydrogenase subunit E2 [Chloroflexota bacterium]
MAKKVIMPKFGMDQEFGTVSTWLKQEGDAVEKGEPILEVETDKVNMEVEASASGILAGIKAGPGQTVPIGEVIAYILKPGETLSDEISAPETPEETAPQVAETSVPPATAAPVPVRVTPVAQRMAKTHGIDLGTVAAARAGERITRVDVEHHLSSRADGFSPAAAPSGKIMAVPAARRLARELDLDLVEVLGTGPGGRIQSDDVRRAAELRPAPAPVVSPEPSIMPTVRRLIPLSGIRRAIAERLTSSVREAPQFIVSMDIEMRRALEVLEDLRAAAPAGVRVTLTTVLVKACAWALARHPAVNASFQPDGIVEWADINIGVAAAVEQGLVVPVVRHADRLGAMEIATQVADLGQRAREGKLQLQEMQGGTFTISNLGMFGVDHFTAIINPPQAAILAVSRTAKRPVVTDDDQIEIKLLADFTLTADHRLVDGAKAAQFLADLKQAVEHPGALL